MMTKDVLPNEERRKRLCEMMHSAFVVLRALCDENKSKQAGRLADAFHNLPTEMYGVGSWDLVRLRQGLLEYEQEYETHHRDFVGMLDDIFDIDPNQMIDNHAT